MGDNGIIYRISCEDKFYIGSTVSNLKTRATTHRFRANHSEQPAYASRLYKFLKGKAWKIETVSEHKNVGRKELLGHEAAAILAVIADPNCLNDRAPCRDKAKAKAAQKRWYEANRETILQKNRERRQQRRTAAVSQPITNVFEEQQDGNGNREGGASD